MIPSVFKGSIPLKREMGRRVAQDSFNRTLDGSAAILGHTGQSGDGTRALFHPQVDLNTGTGCAVRFRQAGLKTAPYRGAESRGTVSVFHAPNGALSTAVFGQANQGGEASVFTGDAAKKFFWAVLVSPTVGGKAYA